MLKENSRAFGTIGMEKYLKIARALLTSARTQIEGDVVQDSHSHCLESQIATLRAHKAFLQGKIKTL